MQQDVRFCTTPRGRIAYASAGQGPPLLLPTWWASHVEHDWATDRVRAFLEPLARERTLIRYDRLGVGLSERRRAPGTLNLEAEVETLDALVAHLGLERVSLLGISCGGALATAYAGRRPGLVDRLAVVGGYVNGATLTRPEVQASLVGLVRAHWGLGSTMLSEVFVGEAGDQARREFAAFQRTTCDAELAADLLELVYRLDVREEAAAVRAPTLVVHRRDDLTVPLRCGLELAAAVPRARLATLDGAMHLPWYAGGEELHAVLAPFLGLRRAPAPAPKPMAAPDLEAVLSARELEVLRLVADGLSDADIAAALVLSPHTVHRHVANIRAKLNLPSRAAAVAHAAKVGVL